jgi:type IV secretion system protein VirD4
MSRSRDEDQIEGLGVMAGVVIGFVVACWLLAATVCLAYAGTLPHLSLLEAVSSVLRILAGGHTADPAGAYPPRTREAMPAAAGWWATAGACVLCIGCVVAAFVRRIEPEMARERLGRRPCDWRGARPRGWARPRDLHTDERAPRGFSVGRIDGRPVFTDEESHIAVIAPTRAGKTTRCIVPWLDEHTGPAIVTSTKRDVLDLVGPHRARCGRLWVFDPFSSDSTRWTPIVGCGDWSHALRQARWLADASADNDSAIARYWQGEAAKLLAPLLHAAALIRKDMDTVLEWVDAMETSQPAKYLAAGGATAAQAQLRAVADLDDRNRGTTYMSAGSVLAAYRYPEVMRCLGPDFTARRFVDSSGDTLFLISAERHQALLTPLLVSIVSSLVHEAIESRQFATDGRRLRILLDEAANIAPLHELPRMLSQGAGHGIRIASIWQSIAQMRERHGQAADTILANSTAKLFMGSITDDPTRRYVSDLLGHDPGDDDRRKVPRATSGALQQGAAGRALLFTGSRLPAMVHLPVPDYHGGGTLDSPSSRIRVPVSWRKRAKARTRD